MHKLRYQLTEEQMLERYRDGCASKKEFDIFEKDLRESKEAMRELVRQMTSEMLQGKAKDEHEKSIIRQYNKMSRHLDKLEEKMMFSLHVL